MDNASVKRNIESIRKELGYTQAQMAEQLGLTRNAYRRIEKGNTKIINEVIPKIAALSKRTNEETLLGYYPYASSEAALQDEHARYDARLELMKDDYERQIQILTAENRALTKSLSLAEDNIAAQKSIITMLEKRLNQEKND